MPRCPSCGTEYGPDASFCTRDGSRLVSPAEPAKTLQQVNSTAPPEGAARPRGAVPADLVGHTLGGRYRIERRAGEGGMAYVYRARDTVTGDDVAIKVLSGSFARDATSLARLRREADIGARLAHPNICHIIRLGETDDLLYIVMPFLEGELLCDRVTRCGQLPLDDVVRIVGDIAAGLHAAHMMKVVHRDLKPENVMLVPDGPRGERAVVLDFGLAKERVLSPGAQKLTATGIVVGTPEFMSPEQIRGRPLDARTDVYALGVIAYEMLTGRLPFDGESQQDIMLARLRGEPIPLRARRPDLQFPSRVERVLARCLAADPDGRYPSATAFAESLAEAATGRAGISELFDRLLGR